jgi:hypothetical protein
MPKKSSGCAFPVRAMMKPVSSPDSKVSVGCRFQPVNATHTEGCAGSRGVAYEASNENPLHGKPEVPDVGSMAAR